MRNVAGTLKLSQKNSRAEDERTRCTNAKKKQLPNFVKSITLKPQHLCVLLAFSALALPKRGEMTYKTLPIVLFGRMLVNASVPFNSILNFMRKTKATVMQFLSKVQIISVFIASISLIKQS